MTPERWSTLCQSLDALSGSALEQAIASRREEVSQWPVAVRHLPADAPWLRGIFEGAFDPRLELVGHATIEQRLQGQGLRHTSVFELVRALAAHLEPTFQPPDVVLEEENNIVSAYGCGGGSAWWTRGNAQHSVRFHSSATESPSMGMRSYDSWTAAGLPEGLALTIEMDDFDDGLALVASGPCPQVLELAPAWAAAARGAALGEILRVLEATRAPGARPAPSAGPPEPPSPTVPTSTLLTPDLPTVPTSSARTPDLPTVPTSSARTPDLPTVPSSSARTRDLPTAWPAAPSPSAPAPDLAALPTALIGALFVAENLELACRIERGDGQEAENAPLLTTVFSRVGGAPLLGRAHTQWRPGTKPGSEVAHERLGRLQAELGIVGAGNLYSLYVVRRNPDHATFGPKEWIAAEADTPLADLRLFPEYGQSPYMPDDWDWQEGWWYPYSTFRPATVEEQAAHDASSERRV